MNRPAVRITVSVLFCLLAFGWMPQEACAKGFTLYPTGGYLFYLGGSQEKLKGAPIVGARLEYNFSHENIMAMGLVYSYSKANIQGSGNFPVFSPMEHSFMEQHFCFLGYRFARNYTWFSIGSQIGIGAVVRNKTNVPKVVLQPVPIGFLEGGTSAQYAMHVGIFASFRPFPWLSIGPDFTYMTTTNMDQWIFGGDSSRFFRIGGHVGIYF
jgi:hypothetical protein